MPKHSNKRKIQALKFLITMVIVVAAMAGIKYKVEGAPQIADRTCWFHTEAQVFLAVLGHDDKNYELIAMAPGSAPQQLTADIRKFNKLELKKLLEVDCQTGEPKSAPTK